MLASSQYMLASTKTLTLMYMQKGTYWEINILYHPCLVHITAHILTLPSTSLGFGDYGCDYIHLTSLGWYNLHNYIIDPFRILLLLYIGQ